MCDRPAAHLGDCAGFGHNSRLMSQAPSNDPAAAGPKMPKSEGIPEGLWLRCPDCGDMLFRKVVEEALNVCPKCDHHFRVGAAKRIEQLVDPGSFEEMYED